MQMDGTARSGRRDADTVPEYVAAAVHYEPRRGVCIVPRGTLAPLC